MIGFAAVATVAAAAGAGFAVDGAAPDRVGVEFATPSGRSGQLEVRDANGGRGAWCATASVDRAGARPLRHLDCGDGRRRGFHGSVIADCAAREAIVFGSVREGLVVTQPRDGDSPIAAVPAGRPRGVSFNGGFYVIAVDLRQRRPALQTADERGRVVGRAPLADEARRCRAGALAVVGGF